METKQNEFIDWLIDSNQIKNDAELSRKLKVAPAIISKIRHAKQSVGASLILRIHEFMNVPVADIRARLAA